MLISELLFTDPPEWPSEIGRKPRDEFYGFISGIANLTCEAIAEPPATFTWYRVRRRTHSTQIQMKNDVEYDLITNKTDPFVQFANESYKSTLMVSTFNYFLISMINRTKK